MAEQNTPRQITPDVYIPPIIKFTEDALGSFCGLPIHARGPGGVVSRGGGERWRTKHISHG